MEKLRATHEKLIQINMLVNKKTNLVLAVCKEYEGLTVFGRNFEEIENRLPGVIRDHLKMLGYDVESVEVIDSESESEFRSIPASICAQAMLFDKGQSDPG